MEIAHRAMNKGPADGNIFRKVWGSVKVLCLCPLGVSRSHTCVDTGIQQISLDQGVPPDNSVRRINEWT